VQRVKALGELNDSSRKDIRSEVYPDPLPGAIFIGGQSRKSEVTGIHESGPFCHCEVFFSFSTCKTIQEVIKLFRDF